MKWEQVTWPDAGRRGAILVVTGKSTAARRHIPMTARVQGTLDCVVKHRENPQGWVWPAPTKTGHINHGTVKKQRRKALTQCKVTPFVLYSFDTHS
jgi:hypothetical protein